MNRRWYNGMKPIGKAAACEGSRRAAKLRDRSSRIGSRPGEFLYAGRHGAVSETWCRSEKCDASALDDHQGRVARRHAYSSPAKGYICYGAQGNRATQTTALVRFEPWPRSSTERPCCRSVHCQQRAPVLKITPMLSAHKKSPHMRAFS